MLGTLAYPVSGTAAYQQIAGLYWNVSEERRYGEATHNDSNAVNHTIVFASL